jgi:hypothetical protein
MQTFLPYADFNESAKCLDYRRLGKQRVEVLQILNALAGLSDGWRNHPATQMWTGHEYWLILYGKICVAEWVRRSYKNTICYNKFLPMFERVPPKPWWLGDNRLHTSHRSNLLRKKPDFYSHYNWTEPPTIPYWWPTQEKQSA